MSNRFQKTCEDFLCQKCGSHIAGSGYTNHCPTCLYSKHVDVYPGDRAAECGGLMPPIACEKEGQEYILTHKCRICGHQKRNKVEKEDNFDVLTRIAAGKGV